MLERSVLLIDDDTELGSLLTRFLSGYGIQCRCAHTARSGLQKVRELAPALVILDIMLPDISGLDLCKTLRAECSTPIIMLSARGDVHDRILGLELGADDYLPKPFEPRELLARIESVLRPLPPHTPPLLQAADLRIDTALQEVSLHGEPLELTALEYRCLLYLLKHRNRVLTRDLLLQELRGLDC